MRRTGWWCEGDRDGSDLGGEGKGESQRSGGRDERNAKVPQPAATCKTVAAGDGVRTVTTLNRRWDASRGMEGWKQRVKSDGGAST